MRAEDGDSQGTFTQLSFAQVLVRALDERWTGTLLIEPPFDLLQVVQLDRGLASRVLVPDDYARLGELLVEAGVVMESELELALAADDELLGEALVRESLIDDSTLKRALVLQVLKRLVRVFDFPAETEWSFVDDQDAFEDLPEGTRIDTLRVLWAGLSAHGEVAEFMDAPLERIGSAPFQLRSDVNLARFGFSGDAARLVGVINAERATLEQLDKLGVVPPDVLRTIIYLLAITRHLDYSPVGERVDGDEPLSAPSSSGVESPLESSGDDEQKPRRVARIALRKVTLSAAAPDPPGTGEQTSRPSSEGSISARGEPSSRHRSTAPGPDELKSRLAALDQESPFSLLDVGPADIVGKEEKEITDLLWQAYERAGRWHPDRCTDDRPDMKEGMKRLYGAISEAFVVLNDPDTRAECLAAHEAAGGASSADSTTSGLRPIERPGDVAGTDRGATTSSATAGGDEPAPGTVSAPAAATMPSEALVELSADSEAPADDYLEPVSELEAPAEAEDEASPYDDLPPEELHERALVILAEDRAKEALEICRRACDAEPDNPDYGATMLWIQSKLPRPDLKVLTLDLDDLLRTHLDHVAARYYRGVLRRRLGYDSAAKQDFERVLDLDADHAGAQAQLAELSKGGGRRR